MKQIFCVKVGDFLDDILEIIRERENFTLAGHIGPDGDAIGSCFALAIALHRMGKNVKVVLEPFARKYEIIPGREFLFYGDIEGLVPEVFISLDCADIARLGEARNLFERAEITVCIDHHETNNGFADYNFIEPQASSASEMTYRVIENLTEPTAEIAAAVYAGIVSDTGGFRYNATAKSTMEIAARLMEMIPFTSIYNELMHVHRFASGKALGLALENCGRTTNKKIVYTFMSREMLKSVGANQSDLDGVVEYLMGTRGALIAILVYEKGAETGQVKISLRSQGPNVGRVATELGGGGHALAAGATTEGTIEKVLRRAIKLARREVEEFGGFYGTGEGSWGDASNPLKGVNPVDCVQFGSEQIRNAGVIVVRKEKGYTSHDVVAIVRKILQGKVGHTGTLDPDATGVLPICIGRATKMADYFLAEDKTYLAEIVLGVTADTGDTSGKILSKRDVSVDFEELVAVAESFKYDIMGEYMQTPPMYSAVKIGGKKLYELARKGQTVERPARAVRIFDLRVMPIRDDGRIFMEVTCSKGTYIRTLCTDIGEALGCGAVMGELSRTHSGMFSIEESYTLDEIRAAVESGCVDDLILPITKVLPFSGAWVSPDGLARALNGNPLPVGLVLSDDEIPIGGKCWLFSEGEFGEEIRLIGLFKREKNKFRAEVMF